MSLVWKFEVRTEGLFRKKFKVQILDSRSHRWAAPQRSFLNSVIAQHSEFFPQPVVAPDLVKTGRVEPSERMAEIRDFSQSTFQRWEFKFMLRLRRRVYIELLFYIHWSM